MKKLVYLSLIIALIASCTTEPSYKISGTLEGADGSKVILQKRGTGEWIKVDSSILENGAFEIIGGSVDYPDAYYLAVDGKRGYGMFFLENSEITISGYADSLFNIKVEGSVSNDEYNDYTDLLKPLYDKNSDLYMAFREASDAGDTEKAEELQKEREALFEDINKEQVSYVKDHPSSFVSPTILRSVSYGMDAEEIEAILDSFSEDVKSTELVKTLYERVEKMKSVSVGQVAPDFTMNDTEGNPVKLSDVVGSKLLLVDFWAAWCGPCRAENPNVVAVYNEFHEKGFDVLGVSLDRTKEDWLKAIEDDGLTWTHLSDLKYWENEAAQLYAVNAIPANFLLDEDGKIIGRNLRGEDLKNKVAELLAE